MRATSSGRFFPDGRNGTDAFAIACATTGAGRIRRWLNWLRDSPAAQTSFKHPDDIRAPASTSSLATTDSPCETWFRTTRSTTKPTAKRIGTAKITTDPGTAALKVRLKTRASTHCAHGR